MAHQAWSALKIKIIDSGYAQRRQRNGTDVNVRPPYSRHLLHHRRRRDCRKRRSSSDLAAAKRPRIPASGGHNAYTTACPRTHGAALFSSSKRPHQSTDTILFSRAGSLMVDSGAKRTRPELCADYLSGDYLTRMIRCPQCRVETDALARFIAASRPGESADASSVRPFLQRPFSARCSGAACVLL